MFAGRVVRCGRFRGFQGEISRLQGGFVRQYFGRGESLDGCVLHLVQCPEGRRVDSGRPADHLRSRPEPGFLYPKADWTREYGDLGRRLPCARGVFVGENPGTEAAASRSAGGGASRMQGLYRAGGRFRRFDGGYSGLLRQKFRQGVHRGDRSGDSDRDEAPLSGEDVYPGPSRRRGVRMQQL